ncbi:RNA exonuclease 1 homolog [Elgaria multicarinata webbii]|uniref:RNA exonuclease 1 homolog n=1 Tax=Elgaria multicarinata webbii TaxID=159646 RepID=UPI002FCD4EA0
MLRSAGYFRSLCCPFDAGGCRRPHCQYRHGAGRREEPPLGPQQAWRGSSAPGLGKSFQELERINKEIQSVKTEVEEQKKLLYYNSVQDNLKNSLTPATNYIRRNISLSDENGICNTSIKDKKCDISISMDSRKSSKYVLDRSCPSTDLEYDPLLNYSAGLKSSLKEDETGTQRSKHVKMFSCGNLRGSAKTSPCENRCGSPRKRSRSSSPIKLEIKLQESDDDMLIIDAPPENVAKKPRISRTFKKWNGEENEIFRTNIETVEDSVTSETLNREGKRLEDTVVGLDSINQSDGNKNDIKSSTNAGSYLLDIKVTTLNVGSTLDQKKYYPVTKESNIFSQKKLEMNKGIFKEDSVNVSVKMCNVSEQINKKTLQKNNIQSSINSKNCSKDGVVLLRETSKKVSEHLGKWNMKLHEKHKLWDNMQSFPSPGDKISHDRDLIPGENCGNKTVHIDTKENEIIVIDSSEEGDSEEDAELSESDDTMEECRRIFNEFAEREAQKEKLAKQALVVQAEVDSDLRASVLPGQKKRIAHTAKFDINNTKEIIVPFKAPLPQQICHSRILQAQQQAVQITAAIKSGQAFVAATCGHKKNTSVSSRRRPPVVPELGSKVSHDIRQRYVNFFVEEFLKVCATVNEAFDKALIEEKAIYDRCGGKNMYLNIAVNTLKKLRDHGSQPSGNKRTTTTGFRKQEENDFTGIALYRVLKDYTLTEEQLKENGFSQPNPEKPGSAMLCSGAIKPAISDTSRRVCSRCGEIYTVTLSGRHARKEECNYHSGKVLRHKVPGGLETLYSCCEGVISSPGCQVAKLHVHDGRNENIDGFVKTFIKPPPLDGNHGVFALDCEMCYTTRGLELSRVTVVDPSLQVVYDAFVKPDNEIIDYNTRFSGVTAVDLKNTVTSIRDVQAILLNLFSADTILIGHSLENDLFALKVFHNKIVDTSVVFSHRLGFPHKRALRNLMADYLRRIIQDNVGGHDCSEDATACMELMLWKVKEDTKGRR